MFGPESKIRESIAWNRKPEIGNESGNGLMSAPKSDDKKIRNKMVVGPVSLDRIEEPSNRNHRTPCSAKSLRKHSPGNL